MLGLDRFAQPRVAARELGKGIVGELRKLEQNAPEALARVQDERAKAAASLDETASRLESLTATEADALRNLDLPAGDPTYTATSRQLDPVGERASVSHGAERTITPPCRSCVSIRCSAPS